MFLFRKLLGSTNLRTITGNTCPTLTEVRVQTNRMRIPPCAALALSIVRCFFVTAFFYIKNWM